jgi:hypothetical protein
VKYSGPGCSCDPCGPVLNAVPSMDPRASSMHNPGSMGTWLEFDRVINADRASSCDPLRAGTRCSSLDGWIHGDLFAVPLNDQRRPGQQLRSPAGRVGVPSGDQLRAGLQLRAGTRCTTLDPMVGSMHNPGFTRRHDAQPWNMGQQLRSMGTWLEFDRVKYSGPGLDAVPSMDGSMGQQLRTSANRSIPSRVAVPSSYRLRAGLQLRSHAGRDSMQFPRWINTWASSCERRQIDRLRDGWHFDRVKYFGPVGSCDPWGPGCSSIE